MVFSGFKLINANWGKCKCLEAPDISSSGRNTKLSSSFLSDEVAIRLLGVTFTWLLFLTPFPNTDLNSLTVSFH